MTKTINKQLEELFKDTSFECYQYENFDSANELIEHIQIEISENEVIYYSVAMEYLSEHDNSLQESLRLADDLGYAPKDINSETLATLLQQRNLEELNGLINEIEEIYENQKG